MTKHIHADLMLQYAQDAHITDRPWEHWQCRPVGDCGYMDFSLAPGPSWRTDYEYRRKPTPAKTHEVNGFTVPAPLTEAPETSMNYFLADPTSSDWLVTPTWDGVSVEVEWLERGLIFATAEAAVANAKAMCGIDPEWRQV